VLQDGMRYVVCLVLSEQVVTAVGAVEVIAELKIKKK
jgi:hypothetical protein